jgi:hypothetical protein
MPPSPPPAALYGAISPAEHARAYDACSALMRYYAAADIFRHAAMPATPAERCLLSARAPLLLMPHATMMILRRAPYAATARYFAATYRDI